MLLAPWLACAAPPPAPARTAPDPCDLALAPAAGPLEAEVAGRPPVEVAELRIREARLTGDPGFDTLAEGAAAWALARSPDDARAERARIHVRIQFHDFAVAEADARALVGRTGAWQDWLLVGDAATERGALPAAESA